MLKDMVCKVCRRPIVSGQLVEASFAPMAANGIAPMNEVWHVECPPQEINPMSVEERIKEILSPAIDPRAPYAKAMIDALVKVAEGEYLRGATDARK
jgi:hypothetical protein